MQGLQQSRDAFDQLYSFKEADKTSELKLAGQRYRFNEKDKTAELKLADQALRLGESNLSAVASKNKFTSLIYNKLIGSLGLKDLADLRANQGHFRCSRRSSVHRQLAKI